MNLGPVATATLNACIPIFLLLMIYFRFIRPNQRSESPNKIRLIMGYVLMTIWTVFAVLAFQKVYQLFF